MKTTHSNFIKLRRFFINAFANAEVSKTEVENFLQDYLNYIFELNHLDVNKYQITISKVAINEKHSKRERKYNTVANQEQRNSLKNKIMFKPAFKANSENHYFEAIMLPHSTIENKYDILINKNLCCAHNDDEIINLTYLFSIFGHEVHHIVQYIKRPREMDRYDYLQELHDMYLKNANSILENPREARKLKRAINQHLSLLYSNCNVELYADKKGYDYFDILLNEILSSLPPTSSIEEDMFKTFIQTLQQTNESNFADRDYYTHITELKNGDSINRLTNFPVDADLLEIN